MKSIFALLLITLTLSAPVLSKETTVLDAIDSFLIEMGYDTFDDFIFKTIEDGKNIRQLLKEVWADFGNSPRSWVNLADGFSKTGRVLDVLASNVKENANNTRLIQQWDSFLNYVNDAINNPNFMKKIGDNFNNNKMQITWAFFDLQNLYKTGDFPELGKRFAALMKIILKDANVPAVKTASSLRLLADQKLNLRDITIPSWECVTTVASLGFQLIKIIFTKTASMTEIFTILSNLYAAVQKCLMSSKFSKTIA